jgi:electron transfer flavoprotein beta subunit
MKIYVCVKHVPDTAATIRIKADGHIDEAITFIMNPYDENAVEAAVRLKKQTKDSEVIAISLGRKTAEGTLRSAMAMGADRGILIKSTASHDSLSTARALGRAIQVDGTPDVIFTGREAIDSEGFQTMFHLGAFLGFPVASNAVAFALSGTSVEVTCEMEAGDLEHIQMDTPCVIGAGKDLNQPSYPKLPDILKARNKPIAVFEWSDLEMEMPASRVEMIKLETLHEEREPDTIEGTVDEIADAMVMVLRDKAKVLDG